jgi:hypothetical protein
VRETPKGSGLAGLVLPGSGGGSCAACTLGSGLLGGENGKAAQVEGEALEL